MHIVSDFEVGGGQQVVLDIVSNLDRNRFLPHVCCLRGGGSLLSHLDEAHVPHHMVYFSSRFSPLCLMRLRRLMLELEIDIVHTHMRRSNLSGRLAAVRAKVPVIFAHAHDTLSYTRRSHRWMNRYLAGKTQQHLCCSNAVADAQCRLTGLPSSSFTTFYNFLDPARYRSDIAPQLAKAEFGIPVESKCVGIVGRLHPVKDHQLFLEAALAVNQRDPHVHFAIAGDGPLKESLREKVRSLGMNHKVSFIKQTRDIDRVYRALDCLALTSQSEGLGKVILEAQAAGVPVVAKAVGGVPEVLAGGGGLLVDDATPQSLCASMLQALKPATTRALRQQMPGNLARFNSARQITILEDLYEDACQEAGLL
jgi:glycosyltransferase involved in cell wall biosynthesis